MRISLRLSRTAAALTCVAAVGTVVAPAAALAAPAAPVRPLGPLAAGERSTVGGDLLAKTGVVRAATPGVPGLPAVSATSFLVADAGSGAVLAARDAHGRYLPASTLKTLTALALLPVVPPEQRVRPSFADVNIEGSKVGLVGSITYPASQLFTALLTVSGNDAAGALATAVGGMATAASLMNAEAARLHAQDTHAVNTSGLDEPGQLSSAYDLALIAREGLSRPDFRGYVATRRSLVSAPGGKTIELYNHNKLLGHYRGALGVKNGYTSAAKTTFVGAAERGGHTIIITMMRANSRPQVEAAKLLDWGFAATAAGAAPIGQLVTPDPLPAAQPTGRVNTSVGDVGTSSSAASARLDQGSDLPVVPAVLLLLGAGGGTLLLRKHRQQTALEQRRAALRATR